MVSSSRVTGLAGAYTGVAEGTQGLYLNPAALANRYPYSVSWFDWDWNLDWMLVAPGADVDFDNDGHLPGQEERNGTLNLGVGLQLGPFGMGVLADVNNFQIEREGNVRQFSVSSGYMHFAYAFWREQILIGIGMGTSAMEMKDDALDDSARYEAPSTELGLLIRPAGQNWRFGASWRARSSLQRGEEQVVPQGLDPPDRIWVPWRLALGASWFTNRSGYPYNTLRDERERDMEMMERSRMLETLDRRYLLLAMDVLLYGPAPDGSQSLGSFLAGEAGAATAPGTASSTEPKASGQSMSVSVHAGAEGEIISNRLVVRAGCYVEPPRIEGSSPRPHGTVGADVRVFEFLWWQWRTGLTLDLARDYYNYMLSIGFWH